MEDQRFAHIGSDPKFRRIPKAERKVKIDKRFKSMFKDKQFKVKYTTDKRGRPVNHTSNEDLKRYYELDSDESSIESDNELGKYVKAPSSERESGDELDVKDQNDGTISGNVKLKLQNLNVDYARGESTLFSESSSDDDDEDDVDENDTVEHAWGALDGDAERTEMITKRLAACNMDWDRIRATDLMVLLSSFLPPGGVIESVTIYPSEFGKKRMEEDEIKGPIELTEEPREDLEDEENEEDEGSKYQMEKLRQYQLNRLKYYYAVIVCDSETTSNKIYTECDGMEYESSATKMDLRFIPDDMLFDDEPKEMCEKLPEQGKYKPRFFTTTALQQAKVDCTWDETNPDRIELAQKLATGDEIANDDLQAYLASSSSEDEGNNNEPETEGTINDDSKHSTISKYKSLLQEIENKENEKYKKGVDMEISWDLDLKGKTEKLVKKKLDEKEERTPFQQFIDKRKEKKKMKREMRKKQDIESENSDVPSDIDMNDPYFAEEFDKPEFKLQKNKTKSNRRSDSTTENQNTAELELLLLNTDDNKKHFSLKKIQDTENESKSKKKLKKKKQTEVETNQDDFEIDLNDARFSALYSSYHYNVDPTDPHYKKTKAMDALITEKLKRRAKGDKDEVVIVKNNNRQDAELNLLVKSIKRKTEALGSRTKKSKS